MVKSRRTNKIGSPLTVPSPPLRRLIAPRQTPARRRAGFRQKYRLLTGPALRQGLREVDAVNQYVPVMYAATANGTADERRRAQPQMTASNPNVAMNSLTIAASSSAVPMASAVTRRARVMRSTAERGSLRALWRG